MQLLKQKVLGVYEALRKGIFVIASALIIFIAARNSLIWHLEQFWGASQTFWANRWATIYWLSGENDFLIYTVGSSVIAMFAYLLSNVFFAIVDLTGRPQWVQQYKIQEDHTVPINRDFYMKVLKQSLFNVFVSGPLTLLLTWPLARWGGIKCGYEMPTFFTSVFHLLFFLIIEELGFYYGHRLLHHPRLYKYIHKMHHELTDPFAVGSVYCHPLEHMLVNTLPLLMGPILIGAHMSTVNLWFIMAVANSTLSHCGYHLPFMPSPEAHNYHHSKFNNNFGVLGILDRLHNTDEGFRRSKAYERHVVLLGLNPITQVIPDSKGKDVQ